MSPATGGRFEPKPSAAGQPFWDASRDHRLVLPWCPACEQPVWYPREICPRCLGADLDWREPSGLATVYAASVHTKAGLPMMADRVPYVVALVDLDEGVRLMTNVVGCPPAEVEVGMRVRVAWEDLSDGRALPVFEPA